MPSPLISAACRCNPRGWTSGGGWRGEVALVGEVIALGVCRKRARRPFLTDGRGVSRASMMRSVTTSHSPWLRARRRLRRPRGPIGCKPDAFRVRWRRRLHHAHRRTPPLTRVPNPQVLNRSAVDSDLTGAGSPHGPLDTSVADRPNGPVPGQIKSTAPGRGLGSISARTHQLPAHVNGRRGAVASSSGAGRTPVPSGHGVYIGVTSAVPTREGDGR